uniref:P-type ATPase A domain-containing protein n=1 Tax=mine drainage metagenome TaxID=410659 RepID=E6QH80_9ZZZZ
MEVPVNEVEIGDTLIIRPGEKIAMDGVIMKGESAINEATITGESVPADKGPSAEVFAGTLNTNGSLEIEVTKRTEDTTIAKIIHLVEEAQTKRAPSQAFVDRFAAIYTPIVLALAVSHVVLFISLSISAISPWLYEHGRINDDKTDEGNNPQALRHLNPHSVLHWQYYWNNHAHNGTKKQRKEHPVQGRWGCKDVSSCVP